MTNSRKVATFVLLGSFLSPALASGQDPSPATDKKPNILLIVDTSGSMEYETGRNVYPTCLPSETNSANHTKSRWIDVLEVLTGTINNYSCAAEDRSSVNFIDEFSMPDGSEPPDANYRNPYHRPLSNSCAVTADRSTTLTNAFDWAPPAQTPYPVNPTLPLAACTSAFSQAGNGFIDTYDDVARFGLMTYDPLPDPRTGHSGASSYSPQYPNGVEGTWSYFGTSAQGKPADCASLQDLEVGARNGGAPATEGKMIYFGNQDLSTIRDEARHDRLQQVLLGTRPYGATPINGILDDARHFFWYDSALEPTGETASPGDTLYGTAGDGMRLSPRFDQYVDCGCREQHIILITDGEPNLDLRPHCEQSGASAPLDGVCPFPDDPAEIVDDLAGGSTTDLPCSPHTYNNQYQIITHIVGYSTLDYNGGADSCEDLRDDVPDWNTPGGTCDTTTDPDLLVCCTLHELAYAGNPSCVDADGSDNSDGCDGSGRGLPYMAPTGAELQAALSNIMASLLPGSASATRPVRSPGIGLADNTQIAFRLLTSYEPTGGVWEGRLERMRWTCESGVPTENDRDRSLGDDFAFNVANNLADREFVTFVPSPVGGIYYPRDSIRPHLRGNPDDGAAEHGGAQRHGQGTAFAANVPPGAMDLDYASDSACTSTSAPDDATCRDQVLNWTLGYDDGVGNDRCATPSDCSVIGDIQRSTPVIVDRPVAAVEDETYDLFAETQEGRDMVAYVSTNDGQLHGFKTSNNAGTDSVDTDAENNENFSFIPPAVLPLLKSQYPGNRIKLLDGEAVTMDVVATDNGGATDYGFDLERDATDTRGQDNEWRTILVQAFGGANPGYFALDITDAGRPSAGRGPQFLWQLTTSSASNSLFGTGGNPIITTVNIGGTETAVAVLPGGAGGSAVGGACPRSNPNAGSSWAETHYDATVTGTAFEPRTSVNCYSTADQAARSLTIVRLDSGEILRRFVRDPSDPNDALGLNASVFANSPSPGNPYLDSPVTGTPAAFPSGPGLVADRIFVGDQDGGMWRVDVSRDDPQNWTMRLFFDSYAGEAAGAGKPIVAAPALSVDGQGQITVAYGTGDSDLSGGAGDTQYLYSLTEVENTAGTDFATQVNWVTQLDDGPHLVGPMTLFEGVLYFATVDPAAANVCTTAPATIWGVDYIRRQPSDIVTDGGAARLSVLGSSSVVQSASATQLVDDAVGGGGGEVNAVFGVSLEYVPTCSDTATASNDLVPGNRTTVQNNSASNLQLVFQTGTANTSQGGLGFQTGFEAITLNPPRTASSIRSWAAVLE